MSVGSEWLAENLRSISRPQSLGVVREIQGPVIRAELLAAAIGDLVSIERRHANGVSSATGSTGELQAIVVGFRGTTVVLSPYGDTRGVGPGAKVELLGAAPTIAAGDFLLGAATDAAGKPVSPGRRSHLEGDAEVPLHKAPPEPLERAKISRRFESGLRAIDAFVPVGLGQRLAILAEAGVGKSTLMALLARSPSAHVFVFGLIGERGREVGEFLASLDECGVRQRSIVVFSTSDEPAPRRVLAAQTATAIAEYFRDRGRDVVLQIDSMTRLLRAYREIGLAAGEPPVRRGYPASVYALLPALIERAGTGAVGSITAFYTALLSQEGEDDPMIEELKSLTDGHIRLSREFAERGIYPAVDPLSSLSRLEHQLLSHEESAALRQVRGLLGRAREDRELALISPSALDDELKFAIEVKSRVERFISQERDHTSPLNETRESLARLLEHG